MTIKEKIKQVYKKFLPGYEEVLVKNLMKSNNILDVGCGRNSPLRFLNSNYYKVGIDVYNEYIEESKKNKIHDEYHVLNVLDIDKAFKPKSFDCVVALDVIEHLQKEEGLDLIKKMENIATKKVVIFTPNGFLEQKDPLNQFQNHKSGWTINDFKNLNYKVLGMNGLRFFRKEKAQLRFRPHYFWLFISDITQLLTKKYPKYSYQLLCIKELNLK